jgi:hypothetical protein
MNKHALFYVYVHKRGFFVDKLFLTLAFNNLFLRAFNKTLFKIKMFFKINPLEYYTDPNFKK